MASAKNIVSLELLNTDRIHLFREGIFYKAYERSAYAFVTQRAQFRVQRKYMKVIKADLISLGFPCTSINRHFTEQELKETSYGYEIWLANPIDSDAFNQWRLTINDSTQTTPLVQQPTLPAHTETAVIRKIKEFPIEAKTPLECLVFLSALKNEL
jgi:hypothetical protein